MDCLVCHRTAGYNRAVVAIATDRLLGGLCRNCELDHFGPRLEIRERGVEGCTFCDGAGEFALPKWLPETSHQGSAVRTSVDYRVTDATPRLCAGHLESLRSLPADPQTTVRSRRP